MLNHSNISSSGKMSLYLKKKNKQVSLLIEKMSFLDNELFVSKAKINIAIILGFKSLHKNHNNFFTFIWMISFTNTNILLHHLAPPSQFSWWKTFVYVYNLTKTYQQYLYMIVTMYIRYTFLSNHNSHKSLCGFCFWFSDPLIDRF